MAAMNLTALALVKIDGDIIEEFVRHTLRFVDRLIVADNVSLDATGEILQALQAEGLPLKVWRLEMIAERAGITTELARRAFAETPCDYLLILDADEFVKTPSRAALEASLSSLPVGAHALVPWETYVPTRDDDPEERRVLARIRYRRRFESRPYSKVVRIAIVCRAPPAIDCGRQSLHRRRRGGAGDGAAGSSSRALPGTQHRSNAE